MKRVLFRFLTMAMVFVFAFFLLEKEYTQGVDTEDPPPEGGDRTMDAWVTASKVDLAIGRPVNLSVGHEPVDSPTYSWSATCNAEDFRDEWIGLKAIRPCWSDAGTVDFEAFVGHTSPGIESPGKASKSVTWHAPDKISISMGKTSHGAGGSTATVKHKYAFSWGNEKLGDCAIVCVQESLKWERSANSIRLFGDIPLQNVPAWWPTCPIPSEGIAGNPDMPNIISWRWKSPNLEDVHGISVGANNSGLQQARSGTVIARVTQVVKASGTSCGSGDTPGPGGGAPKPWSITKTYYFEWIVTGSGSTKSIAQKEKTN